MKKYLTNKEILEFFVESSHCSSKRDYARYLSLKYDLTVNGQQLHQYQKTESKTIAYLLLREAIEKGNLV